ncbi:MAG: DnaA/Hda family protein [Rhodospirillales bacterium]
MTEPEQLPLGFSARPAFGEPDYVVSDCNAEAIGWLDLWPDWPAPLLAVSGPAASGKTHLCHVFRGRSDALMLRGNLLSERDIERVIDRPAAVVVDAADHVAGQTEPERRLFHVFNAVSAAGGALLITGQTPPNTWPVILPDLRSRLATANVVAIDGPDDGLLAALLVKQFSDRQLRVPAEVVTFIVRRMERSFEAARNIVEKLDRAALAERRNITLPLARRVIEQTPI